MKKLLTTLLLGAALTFTTGCDEFEIDIDVDDGFGRNRGFIGTTVDYVTDFFYDDYYYEETYYYDDYYYEDSYYYDDYYYDDGYWW